MSGWYRCADLSAAVDAYDALGVEPGPATAGYTPFQRVAHLSSVPMKTITKCYARTLQDVGDNTELANFVFQYYGMLQGKAREAYDLQRYKDTSEAAIYSKCIKNHCFYMFLFQKNVAYSDSNLLEMLERKTIAGED